MPLAPLLWVQLLVACSRMLMRRRKYIYDRFVVVFVLKSLYLHNGHPWCMSYVRAHIGQDEFMVRSECRRLTKTQKVKL